MPRREESSKVGETVRSTEGLASCMPTQLSAPTVSSQGNEAKSSWASMRQADVASPSSTVVRSEGCLGQVLMQYDGHRNIQTVKVSPNPGLF
jgi:hypothetical protein